MKLIEWDENAFRRKYSGVKVRDGEHLAEMLRAEGYLVMDAWGTSAAIKTIVGGLDMCMVFTVPEITASDGTIQEKPLCCTNTEKPIITDKIKAQIEQVRRGGKSNMLDIKAVQRIAHDEQLYELVCFMEDNRKAYAEYIMTGECEDD